MKLDMGRAWNEATARVAGNKDVIGVVAGVFFFLPYLALSLLMPNAAQPQVNPEDTAAMVEALAAIYAENWWAFLLTSILQMIGMLALFALLTDSARPTVGEALSRGVKGFPSYLAAQILATIAIVATAALPISFAAATGNPAIGLLALITVPIGIYFLIKFTLIGPVIGIEGKLNPFEVLSRSWQLTKRNSLRIFFFFALLFVVFLVISILITLIAGVMFAAAGGPIEVIGNAFVSSLVNAVFVVLYLAVLASIHGQLAGPRSESLNVTFE